MSSGNQLGSAAEYVTGMKEDESHDEEKNPTWMPVSLESVKCAEQLM